ncbi:MAG: TonB-dependent receptor [Deltaproteobacteria bacterium]|nr:TonB-dependent receptor [Deltaproteobacteria bacterium]
MIGNAWIRKAMPGIFFLLAAYASAAADGEVPTTELETITVTAERFPVQEKESPRFVTVVTSEELKQTGADNLVDALRRTGGFAYKAYGPLGTSHGGMSSTLSIRGIKDGELVLINGVPIQGAAGHAYDLNTIPVDQIERVEILKGAASTLYGADAMSGVINIITKKPGEEFSAKGSVEFGSDSYHNHSVSASCPGVNIGFNYQHLGAQTEISRSYTSKYRYDMDATDSYAVNLNADPFEKLHFDYLGSFNQTGFQKVYDAKKPFEGTDQDQIKHFADLRFETSDLRAKMFGNYDIMRRSVYTSKDPDDNNRNYNGGLEGDFRFDLSDWRFTTGASAIYRGADYSNQYGEHHRNDYAVFLEMKKTLFERLNATVGVREQYIDGESGTADYDRFLPSFGLSYKATEHVNLFANAGKAFRAPTFNNLYYKSSFMVGNPDLKPEEGWTYETGVKYDMDMLRLRLAAFYMAYQDKIEIDRSKGYPQTYFNAGNYQSKGMEWELGITPFLHQTGWPRSIFLYTAGYWADPTAEDTSGNEYQSGPKFQNSVGISYVTDPLVLDLNCQILTARERNLDSYAALNLSGKIKAWKGYVTFGVDNIFDVDVQITGDLSETASNRYVYWDLGRVFKVGYEISF